MEFVQDNQSSSKKGVLRGLHFQINFPQDKLVQRSEREVFDVAVDLEKDPKHTDNGMGYLFLLKIRSSFSFRRTLH